MEKGRAGGEYGYNRIGKEGWVWGCVVVVMVCREKDVCGRE